MEILLGQDDPALCDQLGAELTRAGHRVQIERTGPGVLDASQRDGFDVLVIDAALPALSGFEVVERLRARSNVTPVLFLSGFSDVSHRIRGLAVGADDYLGKPVVVAELLARLVALHRRAHRCWARAAGRPRTWELDPLLREVRAAGKRIALQPREWSLLQLFLEHEGQVLTKAFLLEQAWGLRFDPGTNVVDAVVCRLRRKLDTPGHPSHVRTIRGLGYRFDSDPVDESEDRHVTRRSDIRISGSAGTSGLPCAGRFGGGVPGSNPPDILPEDSVPQI